MVRKAGEGDTECCECGCRAVSATDSCSSRDPVAVVSMAIGRDYLRLADLTYPSLVRYACKIGADFVSLAQRTIPEAGPHWEKFRIYDLLSMYRRLIYIDADALIRPDCPNLFEVVPEDQLGACNEGKYIDAAHHFVPLLQQYGVALPGRGRTYYNSGVMVVSRKHRQWFKLPERRIDSCAEQGCMNLIWQAVGVEIFDLTPRYNHLLHRNFPHDCLDSYIVHHTGYDYASANNRLVRVNQTLAGWRLRGYLV